MFIDCYDYVHARGGHLFLISPSNRISYENGKQDRVKSYMNRFLAGRPYNHFIKIVMNKIS
jgi:hypothetical protein